MATNWLASLGSKLFDAGAAYLQQVALVQQLAQTPLPQARARFAQFVAGLSPAAHAGFAITLGRLAGNEHDPQMRRFIESMRQALDAPERWLADADTAAARQADDASHTETDDDIDSPARIGAQIDRWLALPGDGAARAAGEHLYALPLPRLRHWCRVLREMLPTLERQVAEHRENEARFAAGRYIEDQQHYRMLRLAGAPPDAGWLKRLHEFEAASRFCTQLLEAAEAVAEARERLAAAPAPAFAAPAPAAAAPAPLTSDSPIAAFRADLENELASGKVRGERAHTYRRLLDKIDALIQQQASGALSGAEVMHRMQGLVEGFMPYMANPGDAEQRATPRGRELLRHAGAVKVAALREMNQMPPEATATALANIWGDTMKVQEQCAALSDETELLALETGLLRPAALAAHELRLTQHALVARPLWAAGPGARLANQVFVAGSRSDLHELLEPLAETRGLTLANPRRGQHLGQMRWEALAASHVAVFDLRGADQLATLARHDADRARALCAAAYELGLAFALGTPVLVLAGEDDELPFDIDLEPLRLQGGAGAEETDRDALGAALDQCLYSPQREPQSSSLPTTLAHLHQLFGRHPERAAVQKMGWLGDDLARCPAGFAAAAAQLLRRLPQPPGVARPQLLRPAWPAAYPEPGERRCFHVMPFGQPWSDEVRDVARSACAAQGMRYHRGDEAEDGRIIHAIWSDICRAQVVLVELGGPNLNVMIELAMAHAIGRPVLAVQHTASADIRPAHIGKLRVHRYADAAALMGILATLLETARQGGAGLT